MDSVTLYARHEVVHHEFCGTPDPITEYWWDEYGDEDFGELVSWEETFGLERYLVELAFTGACAWWKLSEWYLELGFI